MHIHFNVRMFSTQGMFPVTRQTLTRVQPLAGYRLHSSAVCRKTKTCEYMLLLFILFGFVVALFFFFFLIFPKVPIFSSQTQKQLRETSLLLQACELTSTDSENIPIRLYDYSAFSFLFGGRSFYQSQLTQNWTGIEHFSSNRSITPKDDV